MKEIIYLDTELMNSMLAQLDEGIINSFSLEQWDQKVETAGQQTSRGKNAGLNASLQSGTGAVPGFNFNFGATRGNTGNETIHESTSILDSQKDILNKAFHDYALEILIKKLKQSDRLAELPNIKEGDILLVKSPYKFYDFDLLQNLVNVDLLKKIFLIDIDEKELEEAKKILKKSNRSQGELEKRIWAQTIVNKESAAQASVKQFNQISLMSNYFANALRGLSIIKAENNLGILKKDFLRESPEALSLRPDKSRNVKILMRVIGKKEKVFNGILDPQEMDINNFDIIPNMIFDILLGSFQILKEGDILVTPIAIFYE